MNSQKFRIYGYYSGHCKKCVYNFVYETTKEDNEAYTHINCCSNYKTLNPKAGERLATVAKESHYTIGKPLSKAMLGKCKLLTCKKLPLGDLSYDHFMSLKQAIDGPFNVE